MNYREWAFEYTFTMITSLVAAAVFAHQSKPAPPAWWPLTQLVGRSSDEVWPKLREFTPTVTKGSIVFAVGDAGILYFLDPQGKIEIMNAIHLVDHRLVRVGSQSPITNGGNPTWLNPMKFLANSEDSNGDESVHTDLDAGQLVALAGSSAESVRFFMPTYLANLDGRSIPGQVELEDSPVGQLLFMVCKLKDGKSVGAVIVSPTESLYRVTTRFLPSSVTTAVSAKRQKFHWKKWGVSSLVVASDEIFKETFPRRRDDGVFRRDLGDFGVFSFRDDANGVPIADPSMPYTSTEFRPADWAK